MSNPGGAGDRNSKRQKASEGAPGPPYHQPPPPYGQPPFRGPGGPPYGGPPPPPGAQYPMQSGYMWQQQYGNQPVWSHGAQQPPMGMPYRQQAMSPDQSWGPGGFRPQQPQQPMNSQRRSGKQTPPRPKGANAAGDAPPPPPPQQQQQQQGYWGPQQQWPQHQWSGAPPLPMWQGGPPPMPQQPGPSPPPNMPQHMAPHQKMWQGRPGSGMASPSRPPNRPRSSPEPMSNGMMNGYPMPDGICKPVMEGGEMDIYMTRPEESKSKSGGGGEKDKGRGSYRCGRCGAPKKGHVCPYQPKLKRRPDEPPPEMRNAAVQVEMDEFMTLRRLNIEIQGFPESYASSPQIRDNMVVGEPHPLAIGTTNMMPTSTSGDAALGEVDSRNDTNSSTTVTKPTAPSEPEGLRLTPRSSPTTEAQV
mmetsp:Transcript_12926/g.30081  ORF Transcript_12926/g.30081 Transcript_12926/m.30081 type:complete len:416 (+) Transcript_12926:234-1481(+)